MNIKDTVEELDKLSDRWQALDSELSVKLREFDKWIRTTFPRNPDAEWWQRWTAQDLYCIEGYPYLDTEIPCILTGFQFTATDDDGEMQTYVLPFLWLEDPEAFRAVAEQTIADTERERAITKQQQDQADRERKIAAARKLLAEVDGP